MKECPSCGDPTIEIVECPQCAKEGCTESCIPAGRNTLCLECEESEEEG